MDRPLDFRIHRITAVKVRGIDQAGFSMDVTCELENPNPLGARLSGIRFTTWMGPHKLGRGRMPGPIEVPRHGRITLAAPLRVRYSDLPADLPSRIRGGKVRVRTEAAFSARTSLGTYDLRAVHEGPVQVQEALAVAIQGHFRGQAIRVEEIRPEGADLRHLRLRLRLAAQNLFAFPIRVRRVDCAIAVNGSHFGRGTLVRPVSIPPRSWARAEVDVVATHGAVGLSLMALLGGDPRFRVTGTLWIDPVGGVSSLPLDLQADSSVFSTTR